MTQVPPRPRDAVADPGLMRPDWTAETPRDPRRLWLDKNECTDPELTALAARIIAEVAAVTGSVYPDSGPLYRKLAASLGVRPGNLCLTAGSDGAIRSVFQAYISPGDKILHTTPTFAMYPIYARMHGAQAITLAYEPGQSGPRLETQDILDAMREHQPRLVCLPNPDSPTGAAIPPDELRQVIGEAYRLGSVILIDEAYYPFYPHTALDWIGAFPNLVIARSTAKAWGMGGLRIGYAAGHEAIIGYLHKVRPMYETNTIAVGALERMLDHQAEVEASVKRVIAGKLYFANAMRQLGFRVLETHGNFVHVAFGRAAEAIHAALADAVYYRQSFREPCLAGFSRFSATTQALFEPLVERIRQVTAQSS